VSEKLRELLRAYAAGEVDEEEALQRIVRQPFEEHLVGKFDHLRETRTGIPEVVFAEGKEPDAVADLFRTYVEEDRQLIASRATPEVLAALEPLELHVHERARMVSVKPPEVDDSRARVLVISAGASDTPVAEEAATTSELLGNPTDRLYDVGVAGISRIATQLGRLDEAGILIVVAGMDGVLPSLVNGLALQPVIAVPTSVGYGTAFEGLSALLTMLNACSPGLAVMNVDNGFGAAVHATKINLLR
jgi:NCAIR mutase (PurE)-related protein